LRRSSSRPEGERRGRGGLENKQGHLASPNFSNLSTFSFLFSSLSLFSLSPSPVRSPDSSHFLHIYERRRRGDERKGSKKKEKTVLEAVLAAAARPYDGNLNASFLSSS
jgi:hypothetical protein